MARSWDSGGGRRGVRRREEQHVGGYSTFVSSPSSSSSASPRGATTNSGGGGDGGDGTLTVEWIWPGAGVGGRPSPRLAGRCHRRAEFCSSTLTTAVADPPSSASPPLSFSSFPRSLLLSSSRTPTGWRRQGDVLARGTSRRFSAGITAGGANGTAGHWISPPLRSEVSDGYASFRPPASSSAAAVVARRTPACSPVLATATATATIVGSKEGTPSKDLGVSLNGTFRPEGRDGCEGLQTPSSSPPLPAAEGGCGPAASTPPAATVAARAPLSAPTIPAAHAGEKRAVDGDGDVFDLAPLRVTGEAQARRRTSGITPPNGGGGHKNNANRERPTAMAVEVPVSALATVSAPVGAMTARVGGWWRVVRRWFYGRGRAPSVPTPLTSPTTQKQRDWSILNPFSPASSRRFSASSTDAGACDGYASGGGGSGGGDADFSSRFSTDFKFDERIVGCVFGDGGTASGVKGAPRAGRSGRGCNKKKEEEEKHRSQKLNGVRRGKNKRKSCPSPHPLHYSPVTYPLPGNAWPVPTTAAKDDIPTTVAADTDTAFCSGGGGGGGIEFSGAGTSTMTSSTAVAAGESTSKAAATPTTLATKAGVEEAAGPPSTRSSSRPWSAPYSSTTSSLSARPGIIANADVDAAMTAAALAEQASIAAHTAAATARQARNAFRRSASVNVLAGGAA